MSYIIKCNGIKVGNLKIPSFEMYKGEYICLDLPIPYDVQIEQEIKNIFTGRKRASQVIINEDFVAVQEPTSQSSLLSAFSRRKSIYSYLSDYSSYSEEQKLKIIKDIGVKPEDNLLSLGGNHKKYLALEIAIEKSKYLILSIVGLDPLGIDKLFHRLEQQLFEGAIIELNYENSFGRIHNRNARVINVVSEDV